VLNGNARIVHEEKRAAGCRFNGNASLFLETPNMWEEVLFGGQAQFMDYLINGRVADSVPASPQVQVQEYTDFGWAQPTQTFSKNDRDRNEALLGDIEDQRVSVGKELFAVTKIFGASGWTILNGSGWHVFKFLRFFPAFINVV